ncbi:MAG: hypothetical protein N5P05_001695 [Chroococcopsis gigantea SAG 12.99]|jgi:hypothetical protein|nr:hypothetical protein [Chlorogloea purpurea SAG 13.99]MDV3000089.1 hypothetical protein [Chroococcopsis gigantea SAG 12.99]
MLRKLTSLLLALTLCWTTVACGSSSSNQSRPTGNNTPAATTVRSNNVPSGRYPVQQATYNDVDGTYTLMLLNTPAGSSPTFETTNLQMARLTEEQLAKGEKTTVEIKGDEAVMYLSEDFKIEYVHNVTQVQENPQTGQRETVVVRQESNFWSPFAGALAGQALGSLLFRPQYYVPPVYQAGRPLTGYGGFGTSYSGAVNQYRSNYNTAPPAVRNRQTLRTTGNIRRYPNGTTNTVRRPSTSGNKSTGSGFGSSQLRPSNKSYNKSVRRAPSFGSSGTRRSFGSRRR